MVTEVTWLLLLKEIPPTHSLLLETEQQQF